MRWHKGLLVNAVFPLCLQEIFQASERGTSIQRQAASGYSLLQCFSTECFGSVAQEICLRTVYATNKLTNGVSVGAPDVPVEVEASSTPRRSRFSLQSREVEEEEEEEEDRSVRRSSRITRYKLDSRKQSVLYDRLITK